MLKKLKTEIKNVVDIIRANDIDYKAKVHDLHVGSPCDKCAFKDEPLDFCNEINCTPESNSLKQWIIYVNDTVKTDQRAKIQ